MKRNIRLYRIKAGLKQREVAAALSYESASIVAMWEAGTRKVPSDKLLKLAKLFGCTADELLKEREE